MEIRAKKATGSIFVGWARNGQQELWLSGDAARQYVTRPRSADGTSALTSVLSDGLGQGSGFVLVDGKPDGSLFGGVLTLARRFGREEDVRELVFTVASGLKHSRMFNPFATGNADAIRDMLVSQLADPLENNPDAVFRDRAIALTGTISPALVWLRDCKGVPLNIEIIRSSILLPAIVQLAIDKVFIYRDPVTGDPVEVPVHDLPDDIVRPLKAYLGELPGYDADLPLDKQKGGKPAEQHTFAVMYFTQGFEQLSVSLGHIFSCEGGDIDMRDIVLNRRILVVNLPALENSDATTTAFGKLVVSWLRAMLLQVRT